MSFWTKTVIALSCRHLLLSFVRATPHGNTIFSSLSPFVLRATSWRRLMQHKKSSLSPFVLRATRHGDTIKGQQCPIFPHYVVKPKENPRASPKEYHRGNEPAEQGSMKSRRSPMSSVTLAHGNEAAENLRGNTSAAKKPRDRRKEATVEYQRIP
ncbi:hypothetical protein Q3G72_018666 [Acer saccharum]|nr:hypothetical protein Q3G72_018666 [Acer saccharum]